MENAVTRCGWSAFVFVCVFALSYLRKHTHQGLLQQMYKERDVMSNMAASCGLAVVQCDPAGGRPQVVVSDGQQRSPQSNARKRLFLPPNLSSTRRVPSHTVSLFGCASVRLDNTLTLDSQKSQFHPFLDSQMATLPPAATVASPASASTAASKPAAFKYPAASASEGRKGASASSTVDEDDFFYGVHVASSHLAVRMGEKLMRTIDCAFLLLLPSFRLTALPVCRHLSPFTLLSCCCFRPLTRHTGRLGTHSPARAQPLPLWSLASSSAERPLVRCCGAAFSSLTLSHFFSKLKTNLYLASCIATAATCIRLPLFPLLQPFPFFYFPPFKTSKRLSLYYVVVLPYYLFSLFSHLRQNLEETFLILRCCITFSLSFAPPV